MQVRVRTDISDYVIGVGIDRTVGDVFIPRIVRWEELLAVQAGAGTKIRSRLWRRNVIWWAATDMTNTNANTIATRAVQCDPNEHVANVTKVVVQTYYDGGHPNEARDATHVFHSEWVVDVV